MTTIILPIYNRPDHTRQTIESLYSNTLANFQLHIVDDCSDEPTKNLLLDLRKKYHFSLTRSLENKGPGASRNLAISLVKKKTKYLYFSDNDVYFKTNWLNVLINIFTQADCALLGASCHPYLQDNETIKVAGYDVGIKDAVSGYSQLVEWSTFDKFGPFDTQEGLDKKTGRSDDWAFCQRIKLSGLRVGSVRPELVISTGKTDSYGDVAVGPETFRNEEGVYVA